MYFTLQRCLFHHDHINQLREKYCLISHPPFSQHYLLWSDFIYEYNNKNYILLHLVKNKYTANMLMHPI